MTPWRRYYDWAKRERYGFERVLLILPTPALIALGLVAGDVDRSLAAALIFLGLAWLGFVRSALIADWLHNMRMMFREAFFRKTDG